MKKLLLLLITLISLTSCNQSKKTSSENTTIPKQDITQDTKTHTIQTLSKWPDAIEGCSCYYAKDKKAFEQEHYIYVDDYKELAYMRVNGKIQKLKKVSTSKDTIETWTNTDYNIKIITRQISQAGETWQKEGKIILTSKDSNTTTQSIYGECGC